MSLRGTNMGEPSEMIKRIDFMIEVYIPWLDNMLCWLGSRIQQLPISSEIFPSREKRLVGFMNMPNLMEAFQLPGDQSSLLQIPQLKMLGMCYRLSQSVVKFCLLDQVYMSTAGTPLQSTNLPSYTLSSCTPLASSDLPASVDTLSSRGTSVGEQSEITNKEFHSISYFINFMKEAYLTPLDEMLSRLGRRIPQLPISSENLPSHLKPDEIEYLQNYKTDLENARSFLQISRGHFQSMDDVIRWEKQLVRCLKLPNVMEAVQLPRDLLSQLQIPQLKQHDSNQNNPEKSVSKITHIERLIKATSSPKALSAAVNDIRSVVSITDVFAGAHPGEGGARPFFHENLALPQVESSLDALPLNYNENDGCKKAIGFELSEEQKSAATSGIEKSRLEVNRALLEEIGEINHVLMNTKPSISDGSTTLVSDAGEDVGVILNCTFSPVSRSSSTEKFHALPMWFLIPANYPLCSPVLLECSDDKATIKFYQSLCWIPEPTSLKEMDESSDSCANAMFSEYARRMEK
ncbi:hypothetical protein MKX01_010173 [Papaver californicum]|nr:hypothetical protein MKX01_010173 [Papaver californicum]